jgi:hypothetical protein
MLSSGSVCYPLTFYVILWDVILWKYMLSSGWVCYPLSLYFIICLLGSNVILWIGTLCCPLGPYVYVILWVGMLSSESVCYPLERYVVLLV